MHEHKDIESHTHNNQYKQVKGCKLLKGLSPTKNTQNEIEDEEGTKDDQTDEVDPWQLITHGIIHL